MKCTRQRCQVAWSTLGDRGLEAVVRVGDHQLDAAQAAVPELAQEPDPERLLCGWPPACKKNLLDLAMIVACGRVSGLFARRHGRWP